MVAGLMVAGLMGNPKGRLIRKTFHSASDMDTSDVKISVPANYVSIEGNVVCPEHGERSIEIAERAAGGAYAGDSLRCRQNLSAASYYGAQHALRTNALLREREVQWRMVRCFPLRFRRPG